MVIFHSYVTVYQRVTRLGNGAPLVTFPPCCHICQVREAHQGVDRLMENGAKVGKPRRSW